MAGFIQKQNYGWCELQQANDRITTSARVTFDIPCRCLPGLPYKIGWATTSSSRLNVVLSGVTAYLTEQEKRKRWN